MELPVIMDCKRNIFRTYISYYDALISQHFDFKTIRASFRLDNTYIGCTVCQFNWSFWSALNCKQNSEAYNRSKGLIIYNSLFHCGQTIRIDLGLSEEHSSISDHPSILFIWIDFDFTFNLGVEYFINYDRSSIGYKRSYQLPDALWLFDVFECQFLWTVATNILRTTKSDLTS